MVRRLDKTCEFGSYLFINERYVTYKIYKIIIRKLSIISQPLIAEAKGSL